MRKIPRDENYDAHIKELRRRNYQKHKDKIKASAKEYREKNLETVKAKSEIYRNLPENKEKRKAYDKEYRDKNREKRKLSKRKTERKRIKNDPTFRLRKSLKNAIYIALKRNNSTKNNLSILQFLPYTMEELKVHLEAQFEPWMNWNNWGIYDPKTWDDNNPSTWTWHIDHVVHQSELKYTSMEEPEFYKCWDLKNLRPLNSKQNILENTLQKRLGKK